MHRFPPAAVPFALCALLAVSCGRQGAAPAAGASPEALAARADALEREAAQAVARARAAREEADRAARA
ncbi:MAG: hypothetical protein IJV65_01330, partial [Kiritimatiellae bacterium]|nr:hypothetical protein [Kiritimatiellia bacterium]